MNDQRQSPPTLDQLWAMMQTQQAELNATRAALLRRHRRPGFGPKILTLLVTAVLAFAINTNAFASIPDAWT